MMLMFPSDDPRLVYLETTGHEKPRCKEGEHEMLEACKELKDNLDKATFLVEHFNFPMKKANQTPVSAIALKKVNPLVAEKL